MESRQQRFLKHIAQTSTEPVLLQIESASGIYLATTDGKQIIDLISGIGVSSFGHSNPKVVQAIKEQSEKYLHTMVYGEFVQAPQVDLAEEICRLLPENLNSVYYVNSGSEAIEGAMKLAKRVTKRSKIVAMKNAYHGSTQGSLSLMSDPYFSNFYRPLLPGIEFADFNDLDSFTLITEEVAAVVIEPIQGEAGYVPATKEFLRELRKACDERGVLLIFDEIQSGMGRTGSMFAFEQYKVVPDILCVAKAFGAGLPLGAFIGSKELTQHFADKPVLGHITTFGGHPLSCAAALAGLKFLISEKLIDDVSSKEQLFRNLLQHPKISKVTGKGLMLAVHLSNEPFLKKVVKKCLDYGLMIDWFLYADNCLRIAPPLIINEDQIKESCGIILRALNDAD